MACLSNKIKIYTGVIKVWITCVSCLYVDAQWQMLSLFFGDF